MMSMVRLIRAAELDELLNLEGASEPGARSPGEGRDELGARRGPAGLGCPAVAAVGLSVAHRR